MPLVFDETLNALSLFRGDVHGVVDDELAFEVETELDPNFLFLLCLSLFRRVVLRFVGVLTVVNAFDGSLFFLFFKI